MLVESPRSAPRARLPTGWFCDLPLLVTGEVVGPPRALDTAWAGLPATVLPPLAE